MKNFYLIHETKDKTKRETILEAIKPICEVFGITDYDYILNNEKLELKDITIHDTEQNNLNELFGREQAEKTLSSFPDLCVLLIYQDQNNLLIYIYF